MTYCVAMKVESGLVFAADTRTNAGVDYVTAYGKMHVFTPSEDRLLVLLSAGSLATTQELIDTLKRELANPDSEGDLTQGQQLFEVAQYVGSVSTRVQDRHREALSASGVNGEVSLILGGQIRGDEPEIFHIYPQGNYIHASNQTPYLQIGESKYGKPMLDRVLRPGTTLNDAARLALVSLDATMRSNVSVGPPFDLAVYERDALSLTRNARLEVDSQFYRDFRAAWERGLKAAFNGLPPFDWEDPAST